MAGQERAERTLRLKRHALALCCCAAFWPAIGLAQTVPIRGAVAENGVALSPLEGPSPAEGRTALETPDSGIPVPEYRTETPVADDATDGASLFSDSGTLDDTFPALERSAPDGRPSTAARRTEEQSQRREGSPESVAERTSRDSRARTNATGTDVTGSLRTETIDAEDGARSAAAPATSARVEALENRDRAVEDDPYAPLGIRIGTFGVTATLDQLVGYSTNPDLDPDGSEAAVSETNFRVDAVSDWSRHQARLGAYGSLRRSISGEEVDDRELGVDAALDLEIGNEYLATGALGYSTRPESASSPIDFGNVTSRPDRETLTGSLGIGKNEGKLRLRLTGDVERSLYGDADLSTGAVLSQEERDNTLATLTLRAGYEISPAIVPFVEGEIGRRSYDLDVDAAGFERSSNRYGLSAGATFDFSEKLRGEISGGYITEQLDDDRLEDISGPTLNASVAWSPQRGTTVNLIGSTTVDGTTAADESGSIFYNGEVRVDRDIRADLSATLSVGGYLRDFIGTGGQDTGVFAQASATWWLNRYLGLTGRARYETLQSTIPGRDADAASVFAGIKLQR